LKILSVVGARPQFVKLGPVAKALRGADLDHTIVHTGQHYDSKLSDVFFSDLGIPEPDVHLGVGSGTHGFQTGTMLSGLDPVLMERAPDCVLVYGDTNSTLAGALSAAKLKIPVAHLEAGLRSRNRAMPEEINRVLTDHAADLCLAPTRVAMENLVFEGIGDRASLVGDVMTDVCLSTRDLVAAQNRPVPRVEASEVFVLATLHRAENTDNADRLMKLLGRLAALPYPVLLAVHPRLRDRARAAGISLTTGALRPVDPLSYPDMIAAILRAKAIVTDSGGLQKEAFLLETPTVTLRSETEWVETLECGFNVLAPDGEDLSELVDRQVNAHSYLGSPYGDGKAASRVVEAMLTLVDSPN
jgi:UDP-N-acetylglucosamine 2-epimerase (non-hydrolysing)